MNRTILTETKHNIESAIKLNLLFFKPLIEAKKLIEEVEKLTDDLYLKPEKR